MRCVVCKSADNEKKTVDEDIKVDRNIILVSMEVLVCNSCGERCCDRASVRKIEDLRAKLRDGTVKIVKC